MTPEKRKEAKNSYFAFYIGRPVSYVFTIPLLYTNVTPNTVTVISILFAIAGYVLLSAADTVGMRLLGLLMFFLWNICDGIDGNIARYKGLKSATGDMLDTLGGYIALCLMLLSMGNAAYMDTEGGFIYLPRFLPVALSGIAAVSALIPRLLMHRKLAMEKENSKAGALKDSASYGTLQIIAKNLCDPAGMQEIVAAAAIVFHLCTEFTIGYCLMHILIMAYSIVKMTE